MVSRFVLFMDHAGMSILILISRRMCLQVAIECIPESRIAGLWGI